MKILILCFAIILTYQITPAFADQDTTEERLMFRYRPATEDELNLMRTDRNIKLKAAIIVRKILPGFLTTQKDFKPNDIVVMVNGQPAVTPEALEKLMLKFKPEDKIKLSYIDMQAASPNRESGAMELVKGGVKKTLNYKLAVIETKVQEKPPVSTKPVDTSTPSTSTPTVPAPTVSKPISPPVSIPIGIKTDFNKFKDLYTIKSEKDFSLIKIKRCPEDFTAFLLAVTKKPSTSLPAISLFITSMNPEWRFLRKPESLAMTVIIDNKDRFEIQCFHRSSDVSKYATCIENMWFNLNEQQLNAFATATKIEAQLAFSEFEFPKEFPAHVKQFFEEIQKYVSAPAAP